MGVLTRSERERERERERETDRQTDRKGEAIKQPAYCPLKTTNHTWYI